MLIAHVCILRGEEIKTRKAFRLIKKLLTLKKAKKYGFFQLCFFSPFFSLFFSLFVVFFFFFLFFLFFAFRCFFPFFLLAVFFFFFWCYLFVFLRSDSRPTYNPSFCCFFLGGAFDSAKNHKRQRRKRQSVTAKRESRKRQSSCRLG